jgi:aspartyl-tRNA(Asn)/glutamyl-tRNA(Gln) amidotransferase subunit C
VYDYARFFPVFFPVFAIARKLPMSLTRKDVENIAHLARLAITDDQMPVYVESLSKILNFVEQLNAADTASVEPMAHPLKGQVQRMRADEIVDQDRHEKYQRNAPKVEAGLYLVPKVIE